MTELAVAQPITVVPESYSVVSDCPCPDPACPRMARHVLVWPSKPPTMNAWNLMHHQQRAKLRAEWREAYRLMSTGCVPLAWCNVTIDHIKGTRRKIDVAACVPAVKAAIDGVVLGGVLPDDSPTFVRSLKFKAPVYVVGEDALIVTLEGPAA
jgi:hypothetical protein